MFFKLVTTFEIADLIKNSNIIWRKKHIPHKTGFIYKVDFFFCCVHGQLEFTNYQILFTYLKIFVVVFFLADCQINSQLDLFFTSM